MQPEPSSQVNPNAASPVVKPGIRTTQFWLLAGVILLGAWFVYADKINGTAFELGSLVAWIVYQITRQGIYNDAATHPSDALDQQLKTVFDLVSPKSEHVPAIIAALKGNALALPAPVRLDGILTTDATKLPEIVYNDVPPGTGAGVGPQSGFAHLPALAILALLGASLLILGCTNWDLAKGTGQTWGNSQKFRQVYDPRGPSSIEWDNMNHAAVWDASGRFVGNVATGVADAWLASGVAKAVSNGSANGYQLLTATIPSGIQKTTSRHTNRTTPTPTPAPIPPLPPQSSTLRFRTSPVALRPESRTLYDEADRPIPPAVPARRADDALIVLRSND